MGEEDIYKLIVTDLNFAVSNLPTSYKTADLGRATQWAAKTLLAKVYLTQKEYAKALDLLNDVKTASKHSLLTSYSDVFSITKEMNSEIVFAVRFKTGNLGLGSPFANWFAPSTSGANVILGDGESKDYPTLSISRAYDSVDVRKAVTMADTYYNTTSKKDIRKRYVKKFFSPVTTRYDAENDWTVLRYADVLLMLGEVINKLQGPTDEAISLLNTTRTRSGLTQLTANELPDKNAYRLAMENERRLEFAFENQRWFDLVRTRRAIEVMNLHFETEPYYNNTAKPEFSTDPIVEWQLLLPIPQREIDIYGDNSIQNPGY